MNFPKHRLLCLLFVLPAAACAMSSIEEALIHPKAKDVQRHNFPESKSYQVSFLVQLEYPDVAVSNAEFRHLEKLGWHMCSESQKEWESFVDSSRGEGREETVFQRLSYFRKGDSLLTIVLRYYAGVATNGQKLAAPGNQHQHVVLLENANPDARKWLEGCAR